MAERYTCHIIILTLPKANVMILLFRYCQELQQCRAQAMDAVKSLKDTQSSLLKHCQALK